MKIPQSPPDLSSIVKGLDKHPDRLAEVLQRRKDDRRRYLHWDDLRRRPTPEGFDHREWWLALKVGRMALLQPVNGLLDNEGRPFKFTVPDMVMEGLHQIDSGTRGMVGMPEQITNPQTRDQYVVRSLMEEAITSSQLEGAATTSRVAKEMIRTGRKPRDNSERMIYNNYSTMRRVSELKNEELTPELVFELHRIVTDQTLKEESAAGRFRTPEEQIVVDNMEGEILHTPPPAEELPARMQAMCDFANGKTPDHFVHPAVRAILLHFWLAYDHPFVDGNGRTARALFYWAMLHRGYWLFEFLSISSILRGAPAKYARSFLLTETDDNDMTYFLVAQIEVIRRAIDQLHDYVDRKTHEMREMESSVRTLARLNHRQIELLRHAMKCPGKHYTITSHQNSHGVVYQTARKDLLDLQEVGLMEMKKQGRKFVFIPVPDLVSRLRNLEGSEQG